MTRPCESHAFTKLQVHGSASMVLLLPLPQPRSWMPYSPSLSHPVIAALKSRRAATAGRGTAVGCA